jgi:HEAT repeat protein
MTYSMHGNVTLRGIEKNRKPDLPGCAHAARREKAEKALAEVNDSRAVSMIKKMFAGGSERLQLAAIQMLGQIEGPSASNVLAMLAVSSPWAHLRLAGV